MMFSVGDKVEVINPKSAVCGEICTITAVGAQGLDHGHTFTGYEVDIPCGTSSFHDFCVFRASSLRKIDDGQESGSWEEIQKITNWQPKELVGI